MLYRYTILICALVVFLCSSTSFAQGRSDVKKTSLVRSRTAVSSIDRIRGELVRQEEFFRTIASRYEAYAAHDFVPQLKYEYVWSALRENRNGIQHAKLTPQQSRLLKEACERLELETTQLFADHQLGILYDALELDEEQGEAMQQALSLDLTRKRALLADHLIDGRTFHRRLAAASDETEKAIMTILSPVQKRSFERQRQFNRTRLVG